MVQSVALRDHVDAAMGGRCERYVRVVCLSGSVIWDRHALLS